MSRHAKIGANDPKADVSHEIDGPDVSLLIRTAIGQETHVMSGNGLRGSYKK